MFEVARVRGARGGAVVRELPSCYSGLSSISRVDAICGLNLILVLVAAPRVYLRIVRFSSSTKKLKISKFQFDMETVDEEPLYGYAIGNFIFIHTATIIKSLAFRNRNTSCLDVNLFLL